MAGVTMNQMMGIDCMASVQTMNAQYANNDNATFSSKCGSPPDGLAVNATTNTITASADGIKASPVAYPFSGDCWFIYGLVNPTIQVRRG